MKIVVFDEDKTLKIIKIITLALTGVLLFWFTFDMTGLKFGQTKIVTSAFSDEPIDFVFWLIFIGCIALFVLKDKIGKYVITVFLFVWATIQYSMYGYSGKKIESYNKFFSDTHHIIAPSESMLVKDTYHLFLDIFIALALISAIVFFVLKIKYEIKIRRSRKEQE